MWLDALAGNSAGCRTDLTDTCGPVLCLRRSSFADNTGSLSLSAAAAVVTGVFSMLPAWDAVTGAEAGICGGTADANADGVFVWVVDAVTTGQEADAEDNGTLRAERTSDAELDWTVADGIGWATPAQTNEVGVTLLATVDSEAMLANAGGNIDEGGMKGNPVGPETNGGMPAPTGGRKGDGIGPK